jgi:Predicted membrane protein
MQTLVICIDRDNDLGEKAKLETPIVGREANVQAAVALGIADPEDSDTNTFSVESEFLMNCGQKEPMLR